MAVEGWPEPLGSIRCRTMVRALRPEDITWPVMVDKESGKMKPTNKLELLTKLNKIDHFKAHDALSDVEALIALAKLLRKKAAANFLITY